MKAHHRLWGCWTRPKGRWEFFTLATCWALPCPLPSLGFVCFFYRMRSYLGFTPTLNSLECSCTVVCPAHSVLGLSSGKPWGSGYITALWGWKSSIPVEEGSSCHFFSTVTCDKHERTTYKGFCTYELTVAPWPHSTVRKRSSSAQYLVRRWARQKDRSSWSAVAYFRGSGLPVSKLTHVHWSNYWTRLHSWEILFLIKVAGPPQVADHLLAIISQTCWAFLSCLTGKESD